MYNFKFSSSGYSLFNEGRITVNLDLVYGNVIVLVAFILIFFCVKSRFLNPPSIVGRKYFFPVLLLISGVFLIVVQIIQHSEPNQHYFETPDVSTKSAEDNAGRPNVLLIIIDTMRWDVVGYNNGGQYGVTPNIDRIAAESSVFANHYSHCPWTTPSFASIYTSKSPYRTLYRKQKVLTYKHRNRYNSWVVNGLNEKEITLPLVFTDAGYNVSTFQPNYAADKRYNFQLHNDFYLSCYNDFRFSNIVLAMHRGATKLCNKITGIDASNILNISTANDYHFCADGEDLIKYPAGYLGSSDSGPSLTIMNFMDVHQYFLEKADKKSIGRYFADAHEIDSRYLASAAYVDTQIGKLYDFLKQAGKLDDTVLIITSDHGEAFDEHGFTGHGYSVYNEEIKVPLIIRYPEKVPAGAKYDFTSGHTDILPTVLGLCEIDYSMHDFEGIDLFAGDPGDRFIYSGFTAHTSDKNAVIHGGFKLIYDFELDEYQLFNIQADPGERRQLNHDDYDVFPVMADSLKDWMNSMEISQEKISMIHQIEDVKIEIDLQHLRSLGYVQ